MDEKERRILREAMELEQEEGYIRDKIREIETQRLEAAIFLRGNYNAYLKVGFPADQAFTMILNDSAMMFQAFINKSRNPKN